MSNYPHRGIDDIQLEHSDGDGNMPQISDFATNTHVPFYDVHPVRNMPTRRYDDVFRFNADNFENMRPWYVKNFEDTVGVQNYPEAT